MATKPVLTPNAWITGDPNYPAIGEYPAQFAWGIYSDGVHPSAGMDYPWNSQPRRDAAAAYSALTSTGYVPLVSPTAQAMNEHTARITDLARWVFEGSSAGAADAHVVETDGAGATNVVQLGVTNKITVGPAGPTQIILDWLGGGISLPQSITSSITIAGGAGTKTTLSSADGTEATTNLTIKPGATLQVENTTLQVQAGASSKLLLQAPLQVDVAALTVDRSFQADTDGRWKSRRGGQEYLDGVIGGISIANGNTPGTTGPAATIVPATTADKVGTQAGEDLRIEFTIAVKRTVAGDVDVSIEQGDGGGPEAFATMLPKHTRTVNATAGNDYVTITIVRRAIAPGTIARTYRGVVEGLGSDVTSVEADIQVTPWRSG